MRRNASRNIATVLAILDDEIKGRTQAASRKLGRRYTMTWVYQDKHGKLFPRVGPGIDARALKDVYAIKGRRYDIKHIAEGKGVVMVELVESYPDPRNGKVYRTPLVLVLEMRRGKIAKGRHYCDPRLSHMHLPVSTIARIFG
jgi:ketosteroid isomerase-like protein